MAFKVPILTYHSIDECGSVISTSLEKFRFQMQCLQEKKYDIISLNKIVKCLREKIPLPPKSAVITFDDGFKNIYSIAYPVLKEHGYSATVFLVTGHSGSYNDWNGQPKGIPVLDLLDWNEVKEMADNGIDFGAHTMGHTNLANLSIERARQEIVNSKQIIQKHIGKDVELFAYPYGKYSNQIKSIVKDEFFGACSDRLGFLGPKYDIYALPRIDMYYFSKNHFFKFLNTSFFSFYINFRFALRSVQKSLIPA